MYFFHKYTGICSQKHLKTMDENDAELRALFVTLVVVVVFQACLILRPEFFILSITILEPDQTLLPDLPGNQVNPATLPN